MKTIENIIPPLIEEIEKVFGEVLVFTVSYFINFYLQPGL